MESWEVVAGRHRVGEVHDPAGEEADEVRDADQKESPRQLLLPATGVATDVLVSCEGHAGLLLAASVCSVDGGHRAPDLAPGCPNL